MKGIIDIDNLEVALTEIMEEYGDVVFKATDKALGAGEKVLIKNLKESSPEKKNPPAGYNKRNFKKNWKSKGKKYKLKRYVGNTTMVKSKDKEIPLANILEYSTKHGSPFIKKTYESNVNSIAKAIFDEIKKEV